MVNQRNRSHQEMVSEGSKMPLKNLQEKSATYSPRFGTNTIRECLTRRLRSPVFSEELSRGDKHFWIAWRNIHSKMAFRRGDEICPSVCLRSRNREFRKQGSDCAVRYQFLRITLETSWKPVRPFGLFVFQANLNEPNRISRNHGWVSCFASCFLLQDPSNGN